MPQPSDIAVQVSGTDPLALAADVLALLVHAEDVGGARLKALDKRIEGNLLQAVEAERFEGKAGQELSIATLGRTRAGRVVIVGLGSRKKAAAPWPQDPREALRAAKKAARERGAAFRDWAGWMISGR